ncbi:3803_t:CDS:2, partial [Dentiscutata erythropus]
VISQIKSVIKKYKAEINRQNQNGKTALHWAAKIGYIFIVEILTKNKAQVDIGDNNGDTPLFYAVKAGHKKIINILIDHQANVNHINNNGEIALHKAAYHGHEEIAFSKKGWTSLHFAAAEGHVKVIEILLEHNSNINTTSEYSKTALFCAAENKHTETNMKMLLLEKTYDIKLHYTAQKEDIEAVKFLLKVGATHFITDKNGRTPLHWAAFEGYEEMVKNLVEKNINLVEITDKNKETAFYEAVWNGHIKIVEFLYKQGAKVNCENINGWKPLHIAAISCQVEVFKFLKNKVDFQLSKFFEKLDIFQLNNYSKFEEFYNHYCNFTKELIGRFKNFEKQFNLKDNHDVALYFYQLFLKLIEEYVVKFSDKQDKKVLSYLYTCALSKIFNLKSESKSDLIIDINGYFEKVQNDIKLFKETRELIKKVKENKQTLEEKQSKLKKKLVLRQTLEILKIVGQTISVVGGPIGIAGDVIKGGINIAEAFISEDNKSESNFDISPDIKDSLKNMEEIVKSEENEINFAEQQLKKLSYEYKIRRVKKKNENATTDQKTNVELRVIQDLNIAIETTERVMNLYDKYQKDKEKLDALSNSIKQADEDIKKLKQYEENINKAIVFMINKMQDDINNIENKINNKSHLDEGITTLINIYGHIQDYYDQANLASYIAHINFATNEEDTAIKLEKEIRANILIGYFKRAKSVFKQWAFPLAHIKILYSEIQERKVAINKEDADFVTTEFRREYGYPNPFFVWENKIYSQEISKLLSGEEITIKAKITKSDHDDKNAIKFNEIGIKFKSMNETIQNEIDHELKQFCVNM